MKIPFYKNFVTKEDVERVTKVVKRASHWANGQEINEFEKKVAEFSGSKYAVAFNSGTSALFGMLMAIDVKGKEVIVPSFTFISTANAVLHAGGIPVFVDIEEDSFGMDPKKIEAKITKKTKAIMPVHFGGRCCKIDKIKKIAQKNKLVLFEDAAEAMGSKINGKPAGSFGKASMFSFTPSKIVSTGEGGVVVTNDKKTYEFLMLFRSHGREEKGDYFSSSEYMDYICLGYGLRIPTMSAALGIAQMNHLNKIIVKRRDIASKYNFELGKIKGIIVPKEDKYHFDVYQFYTIRVLEGRKKRDGLIKHLLKDGITAKVYFEPLHKTAFYKKQSFDYSDLLVTERLADEVLTLPCYPTMNNKKINYVVSSVKRFFE